MSTKPTNEQAVSHLDATLVANFTHQIINPLNGVVGTIDNLIDGTIGGDRREQRLRAVRAQLQHTIELVRNLAFLSQITTAAGKQSLRELGGECLLPGVIIEAAMFFQEVAAERRIRIDLADRQTQYVLYGHRDLLRQVFTNLFENAVKYGDSDSRVHISPHLQKRTGSLIVEVTNKGEGFEFEERYSIFLRGYRGDSARERVASGSGLGLYLCHEILEAAFGASIEGEHSKARRETTFRIRFPRFTIDSREREGEVR